MNETTPAKPVRYEDDDMLLTDAWLWIIWALTGGYVMLARNAGGKDGGFLLFCALVWSILSVGFGLELFGVIR